MVLRNSWRMQLRERIARRLPGSIAALLPGTWRLDGDLWFMLEGKSWAAILTDGGPTRAGFLTYRNITHASFG
ncbi:hypothetical protein E2C01_019260 [Portunus trituberculatus]|uniref:Uncharacterized protein n=1 Tax=Portunus trituberculatus TaxID=210409 RepID=A0A5B7DXE5_PORTR|nr:hypothetical protein [Portunus trituberculatus]